MEFLGPGAESDNASSFSTLHKAGEPTHTSGATQETAVGLFNFFFAFFFFLEPHPRHMGVDSELQLPATATATTTWDPSYFCGLHHS